MSYSQPYILIVEDNDEISQMEQKLLTHLGYDVKLAYSGTEALLLIEQNAFDLILLDLMLPGMKGEEVLSRIRATSIIPVICVSARDSIQDKIGLIRQGADDYITKPFDNEELVVRIEAVLRRSKQAHKEKVNELIFKDLHLDSTNLVVSIGDVPIELTNKEFKILELLMENPKKVFTKNNIFESVWQDVYMPEDNTVSVHVSNIRNKLAKVNKEETYIKTVWGIGFKMQDE